MMIRRLNSSEGQLTIPLLGVLILVGLFMVGFIQWCRYAYWHMRMDLAADASALSAARSQAEMLNTISLANLSVNFFIKKGQVAGEDIGEMGVEDIIPFKIWQGTMKLLILGFRAQPASVGEVVSRLNGSQGYAPYFPFPMNPYLNGETVTVAIISKTPPGFAIRSYDNAYYARAWSPRFVKAQPPHKTTWVVSRNGIRSIATARLWMDSKTDSLLNNGGFPREHESIWRGAGVQGAPPHFNARLLPRPSMAIDRLIHLLGRKGP
jgi:hypothetical protein